MISIKESFVISLYRLFPTEFNIDPKLGADWDPTESKAFAKVILFNDQVLHHLVFHQAVVCDEA